MEGAVSVACLQMNSEVGHKDRNLGRLAELVTEAASNGAKVVVAPEMALCGYVHETPQAVMEQAEPVPGPATLFVSNLARKLGVSVSFGMAERGDKPGVFFNSSVLIGSDGRLHQRYRKSHLAVEDTIWAAPGNRIEAVESAFGKTGTLICADVGFAETVRLLALDGCRAALFPMAWAGRSLPASVFFQARAFDNGCYLLVSDVVGRQGDLSFHGNSMIVAPDGSILAKAREDREDIIYAKVDQDLATTAGKAALSRRRPELYGALIRKSFFWQQSSFLGLPKSRPGYLAAARYLPTPGGLESNIALAQETIKAAAPSHGKPWVIALPPYTLSGCPSTPPEARSAAEGSWGPLLRTLMSLAEDQGAYVIGSGVEREGSSMYHTAVVASPDNSISFYRATHPNAEEMSWASRGDRLQSFDLCHARLGIMLGDELAIPEISRCLSKDGADVQCSLCQPGIHMEAPDYVVRERAATNGCYVIVSSGSKDRPAVISGNLDSRLGQTHAFLSSSEGRWVRMPHDGFDGSWVRNKVRLGRLMEHLYGPLLVV